MIAVIEDIGVYLQAAEQQMQEYKKRIAQAGYSLQQRVSEQNQKYGYSTTPDEEWFVFGGQVFILFHGYPWRKEPARNPNPYPHNHDFFEMSYVYKGTFHNIIGGQQIDQPEDSLVLLSPQAKHRCFTRSSDDLVFNILIKRELIEKIFVQMLSESESVCRFFLDSLYNVRQKQPYLFFSCDNALTELIHSIIEEYFQQQDFYQSIIQAKLIELFSKLSRLHQKNAEETPAETSNFQLILQIEDYIERHYSTVTLSSIAEHFNYTPSYLSRLIQKQFNQKFSCLVQDIRLKHACRYLAHSSLPIDQVVEIVGYNDVSHFYRVFKQKHNVSPNQYRKSHALRTTAIQ